jgi:transcriptional regulator with GAF, ATPase, and Fis domain
VTQTPPLNREPTQIVRGHALFVRQFEVTVVDGPDREKCAVSTREELTIGGADGNDLVLDDGTVSRHHCVLRSDQRGLELRDMNSTNGTFVGDVEIDRAYVHSGTRIRVGHTIVAIQVLDREIEQPLAKTDRMGQLMGSSTAMRRLYSLVAQYARSSATVLIHGETGTGKELIAEAIHQESARRDKPFVVIDCSALSHDLAESELFGHVRGAFTGADTHRIGAFESADGGTIFLDEIGELSLALQPLLLRALERRTIRRVGSNESRAVDVRVIAASHRDLRMLVNEHRFRQDLFYRLDVMRVSVPPLRERPSDIVPLAEHFWRELRTDRAPPRELLDQLVTRTWPGNVRELRNSVERAALVGWEAAISPAAVTYEHAKEVWERGWIEQLLQRHAGNLTHASRHARMGRSHLRELARRYGVAVPPPGEDDPS